MMYFLFCNFVKNVCRRSIFEMPKRFASNAALNVGCGGVKSKGLVLGAYSEDELFSSLRLTPTAEKFNEKTGGMLFDLLRISGPAPGLGGVRIFYDIEPEFSAVAVVGLGKECAGYNDSEVRDEQKEAIRVACASACRRLQDIQISQISVEGLGHCESAAEGAGLSVWLYQELRNKESQRSIPHLELFDECDWKGWNIGLQKAAAQNLARQLMETPANQMTPTLFAQKSVHVLCRSGVNVEVKVRGWAETHKMGAFLGVAKGSCEAPIFLELSYYGSKFDDRPVVLVGSGVTFDSGGLCLKSIEDMEHMRGAMSGAAVVVATARALATLQVPINLRGLIPLTENMPGCSAMKPGDVYTAINGKKVLVENTDYEGRLIMADTLWYSQNYWPRFVVDVGTLTKDIQRSMGVAATGCFTNSDTLWRKIKLAGCHTGDRMWRFPLWNYFTQQMTESKSVDIKNEGRGVGGGSCRAAAFLREFVPCGEWMHLDTFGVMRSNGSDHPYLREGMSGRPTRTLIEFIAQLACIQCD